MASLSDNVTFSSRRETREKRRRTMDKETNMLIDDDLEEAEERRRVELIGDLERLGQLHCVICKHPLCSHACELCGRWLWAAAT